MPFSMGSVGSVLFRFDKGRDETEFPSLNLLKVPGYDFFLASSLLATRPSPSHSFVLVLVSSDRGSLRRADEPRVVYHFEFRASSTSVLFIGKQLPSRTVVAQPTCRDSVTKLMKTDGRQKDS